MGDYCDRQLSEFAIKAIWSFVFYLFIFCCIMGWVGKLRK